MYTDDLMNYDELIREKKGASGNVTGAYTVALPLYAVVVGAMSTACYFLVF
ncbi:MAG: hypothetical protein MI824_25750 [Hyphomicrobiales bacterium]|nr:hypothetical protein [Hyphomicrobiales bacterium]